jgi:hypothetical protein
MFQVFFIMVGIVLFNPAGVSLQCRKETLSTATFLPYHHFSSHTLPYPSPILPYTPLSSPTLPYSTYNLLCSPILTYPSYNTLCFPTLPYTSLCSSIVPAIPYAPLSSCKACRQFVSSAAPGLFMRIWFLVMDQIKNLC